MTLSLIIYIIVTGVTFLLSILGLILSISGLSGWIIPTILFILAFIVLAIITALKIHKMLTDPAKKARFLSESTDDKYADFESETVVDEEVENHFEDESDDAFELVQANSKIFDKKFDTKAVGYWADAVKRFCRNKASLVCFILLAILILLSIFGEAISPYSADKPVNNRFRYLAPKWPLIEKLGILDGTSKVSDAMANTIVFVDDDARESFKYKDLLTNLDAEWYKPQDYNFESISNAQQYDSRFIVSMEAPKLIEKWERVRDIDGNVVMDPVTGEPQLYKAFYYTVTFKYDRYAYLMLEYVNQHRSTEEFVTYINKALKEEGIEKTINAATVKALIDSVPEVLSIDKQGNPIDKDGQPILDGDTSKYVYITPKRGVYYPELAKVVNDHLVSLFGVNSVEELAIYLKSASKTNQGNNFNIIIDPVIAGEITPSTCFVFGTDGIGRDMWCRIWAGLGLSMLIGLAVGIFSIVFGICWGAICGYYGGLADILMERFTDILVNVPSMIILTLLNLYMNTSGGGSVLVFILALIMTSWVGIASRTRIQFYRYKNREYVLASRTMGAKDRRLIFKHILPNGIGPLVNSAVAIIPASMRFETSMSYLGIASMSENSIGQIISSAKDFVTKPEAYLLLIPSIIFSIIMVSFSVMGLGLRDALNPSLRGS